MQPTLMHQIIDSIEENLSETLSVAQLARQFNISPWHFQRLFKSSINDSLGNYIRGRRLSRAAHLLKSSELSIIQIAFDVGFTSHEALTRSFQSFFGYTPKAFRAQSPQILLKHKPLLDTQLYTHIKEMINKTPQIRHEPARYLVGYKGSVPSLFESEDDICESLSKLWFKLFEHEHKILHRLQGTYCSFYLSPSGEFDEPMLEYFAAAVVHRLDTLPEGMQSHTIAPSTFARFDTKRHIGSDETKRTVDYIYGYWLSQSGYTRANGSDYEWFDDVINFRTGQFRSSYCIPITT